MPLNRWIISHNRRRIRNRAQGTGTADSLLPGRASVRLIAATEKLTNPVNRAVLRIILGILLAACAFGRDDGKPVEINDAISMVSAGSLQIDFIGTVIGRTVIA